MPTQKKLLPLWLICLFVFGVFINRLILILAIILLMLRVLHNRRAKKKARKIVQRAAQDNSAVQSAISSGSNISNMNLFG